MATLIYDATRMAEFIRRLEDADMYNMEDAKEFLYAGADIFVEEAKLAAERAGHRKTGQMIENIYRKQKITYKNGGYRVMASVLGKDKHNGARNAVKAFVLNYGRSKKYGFIPGSHFWNEAKLSATSKIYEEWQKIYTEKLQQRGLI